MPNDDLNRGVSRVVPPSRRRVLIVQTYVPHYRSPFFEGLRKRMEFEGVELDLAHGDPVGSDADKSDAVPIPWAKRVRNYRIGIGKRFLIYQPISRLALSYDLVVVEQANKLLANQLLMILGAMGRIRLAYWGHGQDFQNEGGLIGHAIKRWQTPLVHWWFAYNDRSARIVGASGFPNDRITRVMNTIDNEKFVRDLDDVLPGEVEELKRKLGLRGSNVCIFVGAMYDKKRLPFLLEACEQIRGLVPDFEIVFLGSGPDRAIVEAFGAKHPWAVAYGAAFGREKAALLKLSKLLLLPGAVGLVIIDAFLAQVPLVTTEGAGHGPEIDYLVDDVNGVMVRQANDVGLYVSRVVSLLRNDQGLSRLREGCRVAAKTYTMDAMVERFAQGVLAALRP